MLQSPAAEVTQRIGFLLLPQFSMMCLLSAVEPLRAANRFLGREAYTWHFFSRDGGPVAASNGMTIVAEAGIAEIERFPVVGVVASYDQFAAADATLYGALRRLHRRGFPFTHHRPSPLRSANPVVRPRRRRT